LTRLLSATQLHRTSIHSTYNNAKRTLHTKLV